MDTIIRERNAWEPTYIPFFDEPEPQTNVVKWSDRFNIPVAEDIDCPYCREDNGLDLINDDVFLYVDPLGYLRLGTEYGIGQIKIAYCPMCGKQLR